MDKTYDDATAWKELGRMIPVYCIGNEVEREEAWRHIAEEAVTGEELVRLLQAIREWERIVALLRRPSVNDNKSGLRPVWTRPLEASEG